MGRERRCRAGPLDLQMDPQPGRRRRPVGGAGPSPAAAQPAPPPLRAGGSVSCRRAPLPPRPSSPVPRPPAPRPGVSSPCPFPAVSPSTCPRDPLAPAAWPRMPSRHGPHLACGPPGRAPPSNRLSRAAPAPALRPPAPGCALGPLAQASTRPTATPCPAPGSQAGGSSGSAHISLIKTPTAEPVGVVSVRRVPSGVDRPRDPGAASWPQVSPWRGPGPGRPARSSALTPGAQRGSLRSRGLRRLWGAEGGPRLPELQPASRPCPSLIPRRDRQQHPGPLHQPPPPDRPPARA